MSNKRKSESPNQNNKRPEQDAARRPAAARADRNEQDGFTNRAGDRKDRQGPMVAAGGRDEQGGRAESPRSADRKKSRKGA